MRHKEITEDIELFIDQTEEGFEVKSIFGEMDDGTEVYFIHGITKTKEEAEKLIVGIKETRKEYFESEKNFCDKYGIKMPNVKEV